MCFHIRFKIISYIVLMVTMGFGSRAAAQDNLPLILNPRGVGISTWYEGDEDIQPLAACAAEPFTTPPVPAPVGHWIAIQTFYRPPDLQYSQIPVATSNLWLCNPMTGDAFQIAGQTAVGADVPSFVANSHPVWSPDGSQVAWSELASSVLRDSSTSSNSTPPEHTHRLIVYDLESGTTRAIVDNLGLVNYLPAQLRWGSVGILVFIEILPSGWELSPLQLYSPDGEPIDAVLPDHVRYDSYEWVSAPDGTEYLWQHTFNDLDIMFDEPTAMRLWDLRSGTPYYFTEGIELYSQTAGDRSVGVQLRNVDIGTWQIVLHVDGAIVETGSMISLVPIRSPFIAISPDGRGVILGSQTARLWRDGELTEIPGTQNLMTEGASVRWSATAYRGVGEARPLIG